VSRTVRAAFLLLAVVFAGAAKEKTKQAQDNTKDPGITRQQADEILNELKSIRQLLERFTQPQAPPVPQTGKLNIEGSYTLGSSDAPVTIVEFTDYQCPFCRTFKETTFAEIRRQYIETGKVRFVVRDFPLSNHPDAMPAAEAARCAGDQHKFWEMHDALFSDSGKLGREGLIQAAGWLKLDVELFQSCLESGKHKQEIQNDLQVATSLQIQATPSFLIGKTTGDEVSGAIVVGAQPFSAFEAKIKEAVTTH